MTTGRENEQAGCGLCAGLDRPVLLSGLARCGHCGGNLMPTTGKGGRYRYYSCAGKQLKGSYACGKPIRIPEGKLDAVVTGALSERLFQPKRLRELLFEAVRQAGAATTKPLPISRCCAGNCVKPTAGLPACSRP